MMRITLLIAAVILVAGCGGDTEEDVAGRLESKGTMELLEDASRDEYSAPQENRLSESQVQMYLKVREREVKIAEVSRSQLAQESGEPEQKKEGVGGFIAGMEALGSVADLMTADIRAAQELGYNTAEYQWVKERVLEASGDALREKMNSDMNAMLEKQYADIKAALDKATSDEERQMYEQSLAGIEESRASMTAEPREPWTAHNRQLLEAHAGAINALEVEYAKYVGQPETSEAPQQQ